MKHRLNRLIGLLVALALLTILGVAQTETGTINGTVTDATGALISGATVTVTNTATGATRTATTSGTGEYTIPGLPPAPYQIVFSAPGFADFKQLLTVTVASQNLVSPHLEVAKTGITVEVSAAVGAVQVETQSSELSTVVTPQQVSELPSLNRNPYDFVSIAGNVTPDQSPGRGVNGMAINGQRSASTDVLLDGAENVDLFDAEVGQQVPLDSVQEYRVTTSDFTAEYGRASGGVVNVATKSGTNEFHGSTYEYNRVSDLAANTYDNNANGIARPPFTRNQFGYSIGGPIIKKKLFFFNTTEWIRVRATATNEAYVPDPAFLALSDPATQSYFSTYGTLKPGTATVTSGTLTAEDLASSGYAGPLLTALATSAPNTPVLDLIKYPFPADVGGGAPENNVEDLSRVDYTISDKTQLYGRYALYKDKYFPGYISASAYSGFDTGQTDMNQNWSLNLTHLWTANLLSDTKLSFNRLTQMQAEGSMGTAPGLLIGLGGDGYTVNGQVNMLPGYLPYAPGAALPFGGPQNVAEIDQTLSWTRGKHNLKFGAEYVYIRDNRMFGAYENGIEYLSNSSPADAYDALLSGQLYRFSTAIYPQNEFPCFRDPVSNAPIQTPQCTLTGPATAPNFSRSNRYNDGAAYFQDSWRVMPRLTLNLGLRWEYYGVQHDKNPSNDANFVLGPGSNIYQQVENGFVANGSALPGGRLWAPADHNFAPRIGFAYDVFGDGKTSLRGGYGIAYERNFGNVTYNVIQNPPNYAVLSIQSGRDVPVGSLPITSNNFGIAGASGTYPFRSPTLRAVDNNIKPAYANTWNLSIERQLHTGAVAALEYSGSRGIHGYTIQSYNDIGFGPTYTGLGCDGTGGANCANPYQQLNPQYNYINYRTNGNDSWHDALNAKLTTDNLFHQGLNITANYTWAHTEDYLSATFGGSDEFSGQALGTLNPFNPSLDKGDADYDIRNRLALTAVWTLPYANRTHGLTKQFLDGWELTPMVYANSGYPYTIFDCTNEYTAYICPRYIPSGPVAASGNSSTSGAYQLGTPNTFGYETIPAPLVYGSILGGNGGVPTCAMDPTTGLSLGTNCVFPSNMTSRNAFRQPGYWDTNFGIYKNFKVTEKVGMQFRAEMFNALNHSNYYVQTGNLDNIGGLADVNNLTYQSGVVTNYATGTNNGQVEYTAASGAPVPYTIVGKKGVANQAAGLGTGSTGERRFIQFAMKVTF
ncbi:MAG TPA: carboxypeptidase regulatory-like domain-containing protein [Verrucomicrobiae bacterium]|jgi:outer membrane receptor protein involved in Fe transport|nr:carboxypeptidase regulatory-like domain-containing protein [Verrucomicrobiae bacterium]